MLLEHIRPSRTPTPTAGPREAHADVTPSPDSVGWGRAGGATDEWIVIIAPSTVDPSPPITYAGTSRLAPAAPACSLRPSDGLRRTGSMAWQPRLSTPADLGRPLHIRSNSPKPQSAQQAWASVLLRRPPDLAGAHLLLEFPPVVGVQREENHCIPHRIHVCDARFGGCPAESVT